MDKSTHEEHLSQPLQTNNKQFKIAVTFLTGYNGIFSVKKSNNKFYFKKSITEVVEVGAEATGVRGWRSLCFKIGCRSREPRRDLRPCIKIGYS